MDSKYINLTRGNFNPAEDIIEKDIKPVKKGCNAGCSCNKLDSYNWMADMPIVGEEFDIIEVRFKNTRKGFYKNVNKIKLTKGDIVAVEASPGHDIGVVCLTGDIVKEQMK